MLFIYKTKSIYAKIKLFAIALFLFISNPCFAQLPNLGRTQSFALFTAVGAISNSGTTSITGDVGTNAGSFTGFSSGMILGNIHVADSVSSIAAIDVDLAYSYLQGTTCGAVIGTTLGNNQTLTPNTYCLGAASTLNGDLILDANGDPNAVFIIKIDGALSTNSFSRVILIDSAHSYNVFWQINGAVNLGDSSSFKGSIVANGAISLLAGSSLLGRALSRQGAISLHNNIVTLELQLTIPLSLSLTILRAEKAIDNHSIQLIWFTSDEDLSTRFALQRSKDGVHFTTINTQLVSDSAIHTKHYSYIDNNPSKSFNYYRLISSDRNGTSEYSKVISIKLTTNSITFPVYPIPFKNYLSIVVKDYQQNQNYSFLIYSEQGIEMLRVNLTKEYNNVATNFLSDGTYFYFLSIGSTIIQSGKLISQN